ncbi:MAG: Holliday junction resolvase RuvX [Flavobacteriales bacterium]|nr:Holliday junction resolvase RuvX [Flavobacteriales bacterium]
MGKILAIDYGTKRCGLAITDSLKIIASALETVETGKIHDYLHKLFEKDDIECVVIGEAKRFSGEDSAVEKSITPLVNFLKKRYPQIKLERQDESFTSSLAMDSMIQAGFTKKQRREKGNIDKISAVLILQAYMEKN